MLQIAVALHSQPFVNSYPTPLHGTHHFSWYTEEEFDVLQANLTTFDP